MDAETAAAIKAIRKAYVEGGKRNGEPCHSETCLALATRRVFWPVLAGEQPPLYCDRCAAWARDVLEAMGIAYHEQKLDVPLNRVTATREIDLTDK